MITNKVENPKEFFEKLGGIHDAVIESFSWESDKKELTLEIDDLNSCFEGLPEYVGLCPVTVVFSKISFLDLNLQVFSDNISVYDLEISAIKDGHQIEIKCSPGGLIKIVCDNITVEYRA